MEILSEHLHNHMLAACASCCAQSSESRTNVADTRQRDSAHRVLWSSHLTEEPNVAVTVGQRDLRWLRAYVRYAPLSFVLSPRFKRACIELPQEAEIRYSQILWQNMCRTSSSQTCAAKTPAATGEGGSTKRRSSERASPTKRNPTLYCKSALSAPINRDPAPLIFDGRRSVVLWSEAQIQ